MKIKICNNAKTVLVFNENGSDGYVFGNRVSEKPLNFKQVIGFIKRKEKFNYKHFSRCEEDFEVFAKNVLKVDLIKHTNIRAALLGRV